MDQSQNQSMSNQAGQAMGQAKVGFLALTHLLDVFVPV